MAVSLVPSGTMTTCAPCRGLSAITKASIAGKRQRSKHKSEANFSRIIRDAEDGQIGMGFRKRKLRQKIGESHELFLSLFVGRSGPPKVVCKNKKPTSRNLSAVGRNRIRWKLEGQLNESAIPMPEDTCAQR
jgi:hypothetical protein